MFRTDWDWIFLKAKELIYAKVMYSQCWDFIYYMSYK